jgi:hypothetical protein
MEEEQRDTLFLGLLMGTFSSVKDRVPPLLFDRVSEGRLP